MEKLYEEVCGVPPALRDTKEAEAAVRRLGTYRGDRSTAMLLNIALGCGAFPWPNAQREAMNVLASRHDPGISNPLAGLLQPHLTLATRQAAADALQTMRCTGECVLSILHYLERVFCGESNLEDRAVGYNEKMRANLTKDQEGLYQTLYAVLKREARATMLALRDVYGIGTDAPSTFGLVLLSRMQFREACPAVLESQALVEGSADIFHAPREELRATLDALKCR